MTQSQSQTWDPERYQRNAGFVAQLGTPLLDLLKPAAGERVLDLGCGDGILTLKLVDASCEVVGIDGSAEQVAAARSRGVDARVGDGQELTFEGEFDAVFSNAALHWMKRSEDVVAGVWRALRPGGRFVAEFGGGDNVKQIRTALHDALRARGIDPWQHDPWYYPTDDEYRALLEQHGFTVQFIALIPRPTPLPGDIADWMATFCEPFLNAVPEADCPAFIAEVREALRPALQQSDGSWSADYVRLRVAATKPA